MKTIQSYFDILVFDILVWNGTSRFYSDFGLGIALSMTTNYTIDKKEELYHVYNNVEFHIGSSWTRLTRSFVLKPTSNQ